MVLPLDSQGHDRAVGQGFRETHGGFGRLQNLPVAAAAGFRRRYLRRVAENLDLEVDYEGSLLLYYTTNALNSQA